MNLWRRGSSTEPSHEHTRVHKSTAPTTTPEKTPSQEPPLEAGSWEKPRHVLPTPPVENRSFAPRRSHIANDKKRVHSVNISMSEEEQRLLRSFAAGLDRTFTEWARAVLFHAANIPIPPRSRGE